MAEITIYMELSKRQFAGLLAQEYSFCLPKGTKLASKKPSRCMHIRCDSEASADVLKKALRLDGINFNVVGANQNSPKKPTSIKGTIFSVGANR